MATFATRAYNDTAAAEANEPEQAVLAAIAECDDELGMEEAQEYRQKVTKWIRGSLQCIQDSLFWFVMSAAYKTREPVRHMFGILSLYAKAASARVKAPHSNPCPSDDLPIVDFVTRRLQQIDDEFIALRTGITAWTQHTIENLKGMICWNNENTVSPDDLEAIALKLVLLNHASFQRRIVALFSKPPVCIAER